MTMSETQAESAVSHRIQPDDELIKLPALRRLFGGVAVSTIYADAELMALRVYVTAARANSRSVHWIKREVLRLRSQRVDRSAQRVAAEPPRRGAEVAQQVREPREPTAKRRPGRPRRAAPASAKRRTSKETNETAATTPAE